MSRGVEPHLSHKVLGKGRGGGEREERGEREGGEGGRERGERERGGGRGRGERGL